MNWRPQAASPSSCSATQDKIGLHCPSAGYGHTAQRFFATPSPLPSASYFSTPCSNPTVHRQICAHAVCQAALSWGQGGGDANERKAIPGIGGSPEAAQFSRPVGGRLQFHVDAWMAITQDKWTQDVIIHGYHPHFLSPSPLRSVPPGWSASPVSPRLDDEVLAREGSHVFVVPKKTGDFRLVSKSIFVLFTEGKSSSSSPSRSGCLRRRAFSRH